MKSFKKTLKKRFNRKYIAPKRKNKFTLFNLKKTLRKFVFFGYDFGLQCQKLGSAAASTAIEIEMFNKSFIKATYSETTGGIVLQIDSSGGSC